MKSVRSSFVSVGRSVRVAMRAAAIVISTTLLTFGGDAQAAHGDDDAPALSKQEIDAAVSRLGSRKFAEREAATSLLWRAGEAASPALERAVAGKDPEASRRAREILERMRIGLSPDTPPAAAALIQKFLEARKRKSREEMERHCFELCKLGQFDAVFALLAPLRDEPEMGGVTYQVQRRVRRLMAEALVARDDRTVRKLLGGSHRIGKTNLATRDYAAFLVARGEAEPMMNALAAKPPRELRPEERRLATTLLMWHDRLPETDAIVAVDKKGLADLALELELRSENWPALLARAKADGFHSGQAPHYTLTFAKLAGDHASYEKAAAAIREDADAQPDYRWNCAKSFLMSEAWQDADAMLKPMEPNYYAHLVDRGEFARAFAAAKLPRDPADYAAWFKLRAEHLAVFGSNGYAHANLGLRLARTCRTLGEDEAAAALLDAMSAAARGKKPVCRPGSVIGLLIQFGRRVEAERLAIEHLRDEQLTYENLKKLYPDDVERLNGLAHVVRKNFPDDDNATFWKKLQELRTPNTPTAQAILPTKAAVEYAKSVAQKAKWYYDVAQIHALAKLCAERGEIIAAIDILEAEIRAADTAPDRKEDDTNHHQQIAALRVVGEIQAAAGDWRAAAAAYERAWRREPMRPQALFLKGRALVRAGEREAGEQAMESARLLPLGDSDIRGEFAYDLSRLKLTDEAAAQYASLSRYGPINPSQWYISNAVQEVAKRIGDREPLRASRLLRFVVADCLGSHTGVTDFETACPELMREFHCFRAAAMLRERRFDEALAETTAAQAAQPINAEPFEAIVMEFDRLGRRDDADRVFRTTYDRLAAIARDYPRSAEFRNRAAWFAARCNRRLDDALTLAQEAVRLRPIAGAYLDTLAEVYFRRGDRAQAIAWSTQAVKLDPKNKALQDQFRRFSTAELPRP